MIATGSESDPVSTAQCMTVPRTAIVPSGSSARSRLMTWTRSRRLIEKEGGKVTVPKMVIPGVGELIQFGDTEGNIACAMRYFDETKGRL